MGIKSSGGVFRKKMICQDENGGNVKNIQYGVVELEWDEYNYIE